MAKHITSDAELTELLREREYTLNVSLEEEDEVGVKFVYEARSATRNHTCALHTTAIEPVSRGLVVVVRNIRAGLLKEIDRQAANFPVLPAPVVPAVSQPSAENADAGGREAAP